MPGKAGIPWSPVPGHVRWWHSSSGPGATGPVIESMRRPGAARCGRGRAAIPYWPHPVLRPWAATVAGREPQEAHISNRQHLGNGKANVFGRE